MITAEWLRERLDYDPMTGTFRWKVSRPHMKIGDVAGWVNPRGYLIIKLKNRGYRASRLAWLYVHGRWPVSDIDHENLIKTDNRLSNLREATRSQNISNQSLRRTNTSGFKGVSFYKRTQKWRAEIQVDGRYMHLGSFSRPEDAHAAYVEAAKHHFGEFARTK